MKALVTGATGFVGSHLVEALRRRDVEVTALVRSPGKAAALGGQGVRLVTGDLHNRAALESATRGQAVVFHVAGLVAARDEAEFLRANRDGTANLLKAAGLAGVGRFVLVSSMAAGGPSTPGRPLNGTEPPRPVTAYGRSKLAAEELVRASQVVWTILRPPMVYGPRDREVLKVFRLARLGLGPVFGDGTQELSAVHAADLAAALVAGATSERAARRLYYACHPETFTSAAFVRSVGDAVGREVKMIRIPLRLGAAALSVTGVLASLAGKPTILTRDKANEFFQPAWTGDPRPLMAETGWAPEFDLRDGLADTCRWYRSAGWL
jgi:nucleoside-diphosphate-sugar epimerase